MTIPFNKIQNINSEKGIAGRFFGVNTVSIWTAAPSQIYIKEGTSNNKPDGSLPLTDEDATWLKDFATSRPTKVVIEPQN